MQKGLLSLSDSILKNAHIYLAVLVTIVNTSGTIHYLVKPCKQWSRVLRNNLINLKTSKCLLFQSLQQKNICHK